MKKLSMVGATTLAGTLLFTDVGHQAHATDLSENDAEKAVKNFVQNSPKHHPDKDTSYTDLKSLNTLDIENTYEIAFADKSSESPISLYIKRDTGEIYDSNGHILNKKNSSDEANEKT